MGLFDIFKSNQKTVGMFVSESAFKSNRTRQAEMTPQTMGQLREIEVTEDKELKLEFFFYTNTLQKAQGLDKELKSLRYSVTHEKSAGEKNLFVVTGWSTKMKMSELVVSNWTDQMCDLGFNHDCEFDGWGTTPDQ